MSKPPVRTQSRTFSRYTRDATALLGGLIRAARKERNHTEQEIADRAGISRALLRRIEKGDMNCGIGSVFEVATIVGVELFDSDAEALSRQLAHNKEKLALLPKSIRRKHKEVLDDF